MARPEEAFEVQGKRVEGKSVFKGAGEDGDRVTPGISGSVMRRIGAEGCFFIDIDSGIMTVE